MPVAAPYTVEVAQKKASLGSDDLHIKDAHGHTIFKMDSHTLSLHDKKVLLDPGGKPILCAYKAKARRYYHTEADTIDKLSSELLQHCAAALAVGVFSIASLNSTSSVVMPLPSRSPKANSAISSHDYRASKLSAE